MLIPRALPFARALRRIEDKKGQRSMWDTNWLAVKYPDRIGQLDGR